MAHGKNSRALVDGFSMTSFARSAGVTLMKETADCTVIEDEDHEYVPGQKGGRFPFSLIYKGGELQVRAALSTSIASDDVHYVSYGPEGFAPGKAVFFGRSHENSASAVGDSKSVVSVALSYEATGGVTMGVSLVSPFN